MVNAEALSADDWQAQVEEIMALQATFSPEEFRIISAPGTSSSSGPSTSTGLQQQQGQGDCEDGASEEGAGGGAISAEELLMAGPPPDLVACAPLVCEALVHVDVPAGGLQLLLDMTMSARMPPSQLLSSPSCAARAGATAAASAAAEDRQGSGAGASSSASSADASSGAGRGAGRGRGRGGRDRDRGRDNAARSGGRGRDRDGQGAATSLDAAAVDASQGAKLNVTAAPWQPPAAAKSSPPSPASPSSSPPPPSIEVPPPPSQEPHAPPPAPPPPMPFGPPLHHLSPVCVTLTLPPGYPSTRPPHVRLSAMWLSPGHIARLETELQQQWEECGGPGAPVLYTWLDWLKSCSLPHLGLTRELLLGAAGQQQQQQQQQQGAGTGNSCSHCDAASTRDAAAGVGVGVGGAAGAASAPSPTAAASHQQQQQQQWRGSTASPEALAMQLLRYAGRRDYQLFCDANHRCCVCFDDFLGSKCVRLECGDHFCRGCVLQHLRTKLSDGAVDKMACPMPACKRTLSPLFLRQLLAPEEYERWEELLLQRTLDAMEDAVYCPRCRALCIEDKDHCAQCEKCFFAFCSLCDEAWHTGTACMDAAARLELLQARKKGGGDGVSALEKARKEMDLQNQIKSMKLLNETTKACPTCGMGITKSEGCNKMTCSHCGTYFCYKCGAVIRGYDHFQEGGECELFEQAEIDRWNAMMMGMGFVAPRRDAVEHGRDMVQYLAGAQAQGGMDGPRVRFCNCPVCGQMNAKEGNNNNIRCWACNQHFCYSCRLWLRGRPGAHFGPKMPCKQHSAD